MVNRFGLSCQYQLILVKSVQEWIVFKGIVDWGFLVNDKGLRKRRLVIGLRDLCVIVCVD